MLLWDLSLARRYGVKLQPWTNGIGTLTHVKTFSFFPNFNVARRQIFKKVNSFAVKQEKE